jgi:hypothetical protein
MEPNPYEGLTEEEAKDFLKKSNELGNKITGLMNEYGAGPTLNVIPRLFVSIMKIEKFSLEETHQWVDEAWKQKDTISLQQIN